MSVAAERIGGKRALAAAIKVAESSVHRYAKGENEPTVSVLVAIARATGVQVEWLATGDGPMLLPAAGRETAEREIDVAEVQRLNVEISAGMGRMVSEERGEPLLLPRALLRDLGIQPQHAAVVRVRGDSMEPTLRDGDLALIDLREGEPLREGLFVVRVDDDVVVKRLQRVAGGRILVRSDNPVYQPFELDLKPGRARAIVGRVVWAGKRVG